MIRLSWLHFRYIFNALRFNIAGELASLVSALAIGGVFFYIFHDFFKDHLAEVDVLWAENGRRLFAHIIAILFVALGGQGIYKSARSLVAVNRMGLRLGAANKQTKRALGLSVGLLWVLFTGIYLTILGKFANHLTIKEWFFFLGMNGLAFLLLLFFLMRRVGHNKFSREVSHKILTSRLSFRLYLLVRGSLLFKVCLVLFGVGFGIVHWFIIKEIPFFIVYFLVFLCSFFWVIPLLFTLKAEIESAWFERNLGTSHRDIIKIYLQLGIGFSLLGIYWLLFYALFPFSPKYSADGLQGLKLLLCHSTSLLITNNLMFQIDARKPFIQLIIVFTISLFLVSAIFINPLFFALVFVVKHYGETMQKNRYYRA